MMLMVPPLMVGNLVHPSLEQRQEAKAHTFSLLLRGRYTDLSRFHRHGATGLRITVLRDRSRNPPVRKSSHLCRYHSTMPSRNGAFVQPLPRLRSLLPGCDA